jgi:hypothetical protein
MNPIDLYYESTRGYPGESNFHGKVNDMTVEFSNTPGSKSHAHSVCSTAPKWWVKQVNENRKLMNLSPLPGTLGLNDAECSEEQRTINKLEKARYELTLIEAAERGGFNKQEVETAVRRKFDS